MAEKKKPAPKLLSGGNPQIAKGYGAAPVKAYIAAMPGWKKAVGKRLDALITETVPGLERKAQTHDRGVASVDSPGLPR